jgi:4-hydroxyacetophenone monooxygenase
MTKLTVGSRAPFASPANEAVRAHFDHVLDLIEDDAAIDAAVDEAELPALLAALSVALNDPSLLASDLSPPIPPMGVTIVPQGGMSGEAQAKARTIAKAALRRARNKGWTTRSPDVESLKAAVKFMTNGAGDDLMPLILRELGLPKDGREPNWRKPDMAPERRFQVLIIGAGLAGIAAAHRLSQAQVPYLVLEKNPEVGGVWWNNRYPGCRLDTPNFAYSYSFAANGSWPQQFSQQSEILKYIQTVADKANVRPNIRFSTEVESMRFDADTGVWIVRVRSGGEVQEYTAQAVISACGHLNRPVIPSFPGQETFQGRAFHSAEWPSDVDLTGKRVAVIGTGASGFQIVPSIIDEVGSLHVFQRNPAWMLPTPNYLGDIKPGMRWLLARVPYYARWFRLWQFWIAAEGRLPAVKVDHNWQHPVSLSAKNEAIRQGCLESLAAQTGERVDLFEKLTPSYAPGTKRMVRDNGAFVKALKRPNAHLITERIKSFTPTGIETSDGAHHELDVVVYATGFRATEFLSPIEIIGAGNKSLHASWQDDCRAYLGISVPGFPNLFILSGPNSNTVVNGNAILSMECALEYTLHALEYMLKHDVKAVEVRQDIHDEFNTVVDAGNRECAWGVSKVATWYQGKSGRPAVPWPFTVFDYFERTATFRPEEYIVTPVARPQ